MLESGDAPRIGGDGVCSRPRAIDDGDQCVLEHRFARWPRAHPSGASIPSAGACRWRPRTDAGTTATSAVNSLATLDCARSLAWSITVAFADCHPVGCPEPASLWLRVLRQDAGSTATSSSYGSRLEEIGTHRDGESFVGAGCRIGGERGHIGSGHHALWANRSAVLTAVTHRRGLNGQAVLSQNGDVTGVRRLWVWDRGR